MNRHIILAIARKDIVDAVKNWNILLVIVMPVCFSLLFAVIVPSGAEILTLKVSVYDPGDSRLVAQLQAQPDVRLTKAATPEQVRTMVEKGMIGGLVVPSDFDAEVAAGKRPELQVYLNGRAGGGGLRAFRQLVEEQVWKLVGQETPASIAFHDVSNPTGAKAAELDLGPVLLVLLLVMALSLLGVYVVPSLLVEEKERRTLLALQVSPASAADVVAGKSLVGLFYALFIVLIILTLNGGWQGEWLLTLLAVVLGALFVILVGLLMGGLFDTTNQLNTWSTVAMLVLMVPSWATMLQMPAVARIVFRLVPTYYLGQLVTASVGGQVAWGQVGLSVGVLAASVVVTFVAVVWQVQRESVP